MTNVICGLSGSDSLTPVARAVFSENKSLLPSVSGGLTDSATTSSGMTTKYCQPSCQPQQLEHRTSESGCISLRICRECQLSPPKVSFAGGRTVCNRCRRTSVKNREKERGYGMTYRQKYPWRTLLMHARKRAAKFGLKYDLDEHVPEMKARIMAMKCEMTGVALVPGSGCGSQGRRYWNTASLDRVDSSQGYTLTNVRVVCWAMNAAMGTWGEETLRKLMGRWLSRQEVN